MHCGVPNSGIGLAWDGAKFVTMGGSDTEESDSEQPLDEAAQVVAILDVAKGRPPPPLPVLPKHARATAEAVRRHILEVPVAKRTVAYEHAVRTPIEARTVVDWVDQQLDDRRTERTMRFAIYFALNPGRSNAWVAKKAKGNRDAPCIAKGMALHLRCHPFTRAEVQHGCDMLPHYCQHRESRNLARTILKHRATYGSDTLDAAVVLIGFHSAVRHFGAHRYRFAVT